MALEANAKKTEHNGAKNSSHDKAAPRCDLKRAARKLRRRQSPSVEEAMDEAMVIYGGALKRLADR